MNERKKTFKQVCECKHCGNEAEMLITCSLLETDPTEEKASLDGKGKTQRIKGSATCSHCGNEADMWIDL